MRRTASAFAIIVLIIVAYKAAKFYSKWKKENEKVEFLVAAARLQNASGDYPCAWKSLEQAIVIRPDWEEIKLERVNTAMMWLRSINPDSTQGEGGFSGVANKLVPVLADKAETSLGKIKADALAHIGWANYIRFREGRPVQVEASFRDALQADSVNVYAHAMWGFWMLFPGSKSGNAPEAKRHFESARADGREKKYLRRMKLSAFRSDTASHYEPEIIEAVNEMRTQGDSIKFSERNNIVTNVYYAGDELLDSILARLSPEENLITFLYLSQGINADERLYLQFVNALLLEKLEDYAGASAIYKAIASRKSYGKFKYKNEVGDGIRQLSASR